MRGEGRGARDGGEKRGKGRSRQSILMLVCRSVARKVNEATLQLESRKVNKIKTELMTASWEINQH